MNDRSVVLPGVEGKEARLRILEGSLSLFAANGYHGTSIREIAQKVSMQGSAVYAHFASKEHVLAELARLGHETHMRAIQAALLECGSNPVDQLRAHVRANAKFHLDYPHLAKVVTAEMHALSTELVGPALALRDQSVQILIQILERGARTGAFTLPSAGDDAASSARGLFATAAALGAMALRLPYWFPAEGYDTKELLDHHVTLALRMVGA